MGAAAANPSLRLEVSFEDFLFPLPKKKKKTLTARTLYARYYWSTRVLKFITGFEILFIFFLFQSSRRRRAHVGDILACFI